MRSDRNTIEKMRSDKKCKEQKSFINSNNSKKNDGKQTARKIVDNSNCGNTSRYQTRTPEPLNKKYNNDEQLAHRFTPVKMNTGIDIEKVVSEFSKLGPEQSKLQALLNSLSEVKNAPQNPKNGLNSNLEKEYIHELNEIKEQQESDRKLFDCVVKEQREKIHELESEIGYLREKNKSFELQNTTLFEENTTLKTTLIKETERFEKSVQKFTEIDGLNGKLKKERDKFANLFEKSNNSLQTAISILKSTICIFTKSMSAIFSEKISGFNESVNNAQKTTEKNEINQEYFSLFYCEKSRKLLSELKILFTHKLKGISTIIPSLDLTYEISQIQNWIFAKPKIQEETRLSPFSPSKPDKEKENESNKNPFPVKLEIPIEIQKDMPKQICKLDNENINKTSSSSLSKSEISKISADCSKISASSINEEYLSKLPKYIAKHKFKAQKVFFFWVF